MHGFIDQMPNIIKEAAKNPLGIFALLIILLSFLGVSFFRRASERARIGVFFLLMAGVVLYGYIIIDIFTRSSPELPVGSPGATRTGGSRYFCNTATFTVKANEIANTGLAIRKGSVLQVRATGEGIKFGFDLGPGYGPSGEQRIAHRPFPGVSLHELALLAQIGTDFYEVGSGATFTAKNEGTLRFQFNDWKLNDNSGSAKVEITVRCP